MTRSAKENNTVVRQAKPKSPIHCYLTQRSHEVLHRFAEENGVSVSGLVEAMCESLGTRIENDGYGCDPGWIKAARKVDAFRRKRG